MKIDRLETHDRWKQFMSKDFDIGECAQDLINQRPFGDIDFYLFAHTRTEDEHLYVDGKYTKRLIWQPRLTKPKAQTNSMLFKCYPGTDKIKIIWMIPAREMWAQFKKGNMTESKIIIESIHAFENDRSSLERKEEEDLSDEQINNIYRDLCLAAKQRMEHERIFEKTGTSDSESTS